MDLASAGAKIRHVFGNTPITEASIGAGPAGNSIAQWLVPSVIKDTTDFLKKLHNLGFIPNTAILCTIYEAGLYPHIFHDEGLDTLR